MHGPAGTLVPTRANGIRERLGVGGWRLDRCGVDPLISWPVDEGEAGGDTDQQGRWSLPDANGVRERLGVSGWRLGLTGN